MNWINNETYDLQFTNCKIIMKIKIITNCMSINCSILICSYWNYQFSIIVKTRLTSFSSIVFQQLRVSIQNKNCIRNVNVLKNKINNFFLEVWMWVHQKCEMSLIVIILYAVHSKKCTYLSVHNNGGIIWLNDITRDLKYKNSEVMMTLNIITNFMIMHCCINM